MVFENYRLSAPSNAEQSIFQLKMMINEAESIIALSLLAGEWNNLACAVFLYFSDSHCCQFPLTLHI